MQVARKTSRWPFVVILILLLVACLFATQTWRSTKLPEVSLVLGEPESSIDGSLYGLGDGSVNDNGSTASSTHNDALAPSRLSPSQSYYGASILQPAAGWSASNSSNGLNAFPAPTIDELISAVGSHSPWSAGVPASEAPIGSTVANSPLGGWRAAGSFDRTNYDPASGDDAVPSEFVTRVLRRAGQFAGAWTATEVGRWIGESVAVYWEQLLERATSNGPLLTPVGPSMPSFPAAETVVPVSPTAWTVPAIFLEQLGRLAQDPYSAPWANETAADLQTLMQLDRFSDGQTAAVLQRLAKAADEASFLADQTSDDELRVELLRAHWSLARRLDRWSVVHNIRVAAISNARIAARGSLNNLYRDVPVRSDIESLSDDLETYERTRDPQLASKVADIRSGLAASGDPLDVALADAVEQHYRNSNVRIAITATMLNRFIDQQRSQCRPVVDRIAGTPVRGQSETMSHSQVQLQPATGVWQLNLQADGTVDSNTLADGGKARVHTFGSTDFSAQKSVTVDPNGVRMGDTVVTAQNYNQLAGVTTDYDWIPLFGAVARNRAVDQYRAKRPWAKSDVEDRVTWQAREQMDREAVATVERVQRELRDRVTDRLSQSGIEVTPVEMSTTPERLVARLRVAGNQQLGAHTPRPRAPSDSMLSVQLHETAMTNAAVSLGLDGKRLSAQELQQQLREKLPRLNATAPLDVNDDITFEFASRDAVQFHFEDGRMTVSLTLADFERDGRHVRNFVVHANYVPVVNGLSAEFMREGSLGIEGNLGASDRARLHNVFNNVLSADRRFPLVQLNDPNDRRLGGLMITQTVIEDGWLGISIGPVGNGRVAERSRSLR